MKRSFFIASSIGVAALATLPTVHRVRMRGQVLAARRVPARDIGSTPGRCHASRSTTRWSGFTLADMLG